MSTLVDSHCHLNFPDLAEHLDNVLDEMSRNHVGYALCVSVNLNDFPQVLALAVRHPHIFASVGVHPGYEDATEPTISTLVSLADHAEVVAIGETGLDYFHTKGDAEWQRTRFRNHIRAAREIGKPLIIHTREASADTLRILQEEKASEVGGVMHCFTENWEVAQRALDLNFYLSFSGIVTFKNAASVREVAKKTPLDRLLIETDSPYLAPTPHRGATNQPAFVKYVAEMIADLRELTPPQVADITTNNFFSFINRGKQSLPNVNLESK
ncbi:MAG TPA: DNAase [Betaproteobacteria bacterium]|nr:DNAase [Betaproteobacteria bacterium]